MLTLLRSCRFLRTLNTPSNARSMSRNFWDKETDPSKMETNPLEAELPQHRMVRILKEDFKAVYDRELHEKRRRHKQFDIVIVGGGIIGCSVAYWLKDRAPDSYRVAVIEKDYSYSKSSSALSLGNLRHQFSMPENIEMALFCHEFLRNLDYNLEIEGVELPDVKFQPHGFLFLSNEEGAEQMSESYRLQIEMGGHVQLLNPEKLKERFPWLNTEGVALASHGTNKEGWFEPWSLMQALKFKAQSMGVHFLEGEVVGFDFDEPNRMIGVIGFPDERWRDTRHLRVRHPDGEVRKIQFTNLVAACGHETGQFAKLLGIGEGPAILQFPIPIEPRKRFVYTGQCHNGPGIEMPHIVDVNGAYIRRPGLVDYYVMGMAPQESEEPDCSNLDVDYDFFHEKVLPTITNRIPIMKDFQLKSAWASFYDHNHFDQNPIIGAHPWYPHVFFCSGFASHGVQMAPAAGRALMELMIDRKFMNLDLSRFKFERIIHDQPISENYVF